MICEWIGNRGTGLDVLHEHVVRGCGLSDRHGGRVYQLVQLREETCEDKERHVLTSPVRCMGAQHVDVSPSTHPERPRHLDNVVQPVLQTCVSPLISYTLDS